MVFFTCNSCGESLKKNAVEKHLYRCKIGEGLTCIDCNKLFMQDYTSHTSCITEAEKYGAAGFVAKEAKGKSKQEEWIQNIQDYLQKTPNAPNDVRKLLENLLKFDNIPRKRKAFLNFMKNVSRSTNSKLVEKVWEILEGIAAAKAASKQQKIRPENASTDQNNKKRKAEDETNGSSKKKKDSNKENSVQDTPAVTKHKKKKGTTINGHTNGLPDQPEDKSISEEVSNVTQNQSATINPDKKKKKKKKNKEEVIEKETSQKSQSDDVPMDSESQSQSTFKWKSAIKTALRESEEGKMKIKKLQKLIISQCVASSNLDEEKAIELFQEKIQNSKFIIEDKYIKLK